MGFTRQLLVGGFAGYCVTPIKSIEEIVSDINEVSADEILKEDAALRGVAWHEYCDALGIMGNAQKNRARRHEVFYDPTFLAEPEGD